MIGVRPCGVTARARVLVVDDERGVRESLRFLLSDEYDIFCAGSVADGLRICRAVAPEVILMDIRMPDRDGLDGVRSMLQADPTLSVAIITGYGSVEAAQQAMGGGAMGFVRKPIHADEVRLVVSAGAERCLRERERSRRLQQVDALSRGLSRVLLGVGSEAPLRDSAMGLAHDLAGPILALEFAADGLAEEMEESRELLGQAWPRYAEHLSVILESARRCEGLLRLWRGLCRGQVVPMAPVFLSGVLDLAVLGVGGRCGRSGVDIATRVSGREMPVTGDFTQILRAVSNIVENALDALGSGGGHIMISLLADLEPGRMVVAVEDDGPGVPPDIRGRIFDRHFSTKPGVRSSGLGLSIVGEILREHGATIELVGGRTVGAEFRMSFPVAGEGGLRSVGRE